MVGKGASATVGCASASTPACTASIADCIVLSCCAAQNLLPSCMLAHACQCHLPDSQQHRANCNSSSNHCMHRPPMLMTEACLRLLCVLLHQVWLANCIPMERMVAIKLMDLENFGANLVRCCMQALAIHHAAPQQDDAGSKECSLSCTCMVTCM